MGDTTLPSERMPEELPRGVRFEDVWAMMRESSREADRRFKETERMIKEMTAEAERSRKETDRKLGKLGIRLGEITEYFMSPKLHKRFEPLGFRFNRVSRNHELHDQKDCNLAEIDVLLENGDYVMAVEVKTRPNITDVKDHVKRMEMLRRVADEHGDRRKYLGALAGAVFSERVSAYALKNGFYVIVPSGDTVEIEAPEGFQPRIW